MRWGLLALGWAVFSVWGHLPVSLWLVRTRTSAWGDWAFKEAVPAVSIAAGLALCVWLWRSARDAVPSRRRVVAAHWLLWMAACVLVDRWLTFSVNEYAHYPQYALLAWLIARATDPARQRWPLLRIALLTVVCGVLDETLQYLWTTRSYSHYLDFNDWLVNMLAAWAGVMLYYRFDEPPAREVSTVQTGHPRRWWPACVLALCAAVLAWLLQSCACVRLQPAQGQQVAPGGIEAGVLYLQRARHWYGQWHEGPRHGRYHVLHPAAGLALMALGLLPLITFRRSARRDLPSACPAAEDQKNAIVRTSMLSRLGAPEGVVGSSNAVCPMKRQRPSVSES